MALKKSELYSSIWQACEQLRGAMDASQYKDYVLVILFVKYISDKYGKDPRSGNRDPQRRRARQSHDAGTTHGKDQANMSLKHYRSRYYNSLRSA